MNYIDDGVVRSRDPYQSNKKQQRVKYKNACESVQKINFRKCFLITK